MIAVLISCGPMVLLAVVRLLVGLADPTIPPAFQPDPPATIPTARVVTRGRR